MFHEFGHALHGMFSNVKYPYFCGTSVPRDFVEFPSQVNEMWADWPSVLANYAKHYQTGEPMPQALLDKVLASEQVQPGLRAPPSTSARRCSTRPGTSCRADQMPAAGGVMAFEAAALKKDGVDYAPVPPRYRTPYFSHIMGGYAAGYYAYIWTEVLDADTVEWIKQHGGLKRENGDRFRADAAVARRQQGCVAAVPSISPATARTSSRCWSSVGWWRIRRMRHRLKSRRMRARTAENHRH